MSEKYTDAQKRATLKYLKNKTDSIQIRVKKGVKEQWKEAAAVRGKSLNQLIVDSVETEIQKPVSPDQSET